MFTLWAKEFKNNKLLRDITITDDSLDTRTHKVFNAIEKICNEFDLSKPIWFDSNINDFKRSAKVRFRNDNFIDEVPFDYLEIQILEEDY